MKTTTKQNNETKVTAFIMGGVWVIIRDSDKMELADCQTAEELVATCNRDRLSVQNKGCIYPDYSSQLRY